MCLLENENSPFAILQSGNLSKSFYLEPLEVVHRKLQEWWDMCVMKHHQSFLLVTAADAVSSCLSARLSQFEGDEEGH